MRRRARVIVHAAVAAASTGLVVATIAGTLLVPATTASADSVVDGPSVARRFAYDPPTTEPATPTGDHSVPCVGNGHSGARIQVIYAHVKGTHSRYKSQVGYIRTLAGLANGVYAASAAETGGIRQLRFATNAHCVLNVKTVTLPRGGLFGGPSVQFILLEQWLAQHGYGHRHHIYAVLLDTTKGGYCGEGTVPAGNPVSAQPQYAVLGERSCWDTRTLAHEIGHTLGAVSKTAPHHTRPAGHCFDAWDLMCDNQFSTPHPVMTCPWTHYSFLDCKHDDYFNTSPKPGSYLAKHWNVARSAFLTRGRPANDSFANATVTPVFCQGCGHADKSWISGVPDAYNVGSGTTLNATAQHGEPTTAGVNGRHSVWFRVTAPTDGTLTLDTQGSGFDTVLGAYRGTTVSSLTLVGENDDAGSGETFSRAILSVTAGKTYAVKVDGKNGAVGEVVLHAFLSNTQPPIITSISPTSGPPGTPITVTGSNLTCGGGSTPYLVMIEGVDADGPLSLAPTSVGFTAGAKSRSLGWLPGASGPITWAFDCGVAVSTQSFTLTP